MTPRAWAGLLPRRALAGVPALALLLVGLVATARGALGDADPGVVRVCTGESPSFVELRDGAESKLDQDLDPLEYTSTYRGVAVDFTDVVLRQLAGFQYVGESAVPIATPSRRPRPPRDPAAAGGRRSPPPARPDPQ